MKEALDIRPGLGGAGFSKPSGIVTADIDPTTGFLASPDCPEHREEVFIAGTQPFATCMHDLSSEDYLATDISDFGMAATDSEGNPVDYNHLTLEICADTGLLATSDCPHVTRKRFELGREPLELCRGEGHVKVSAEPAVEASLTLALGASQHKKKRNGFNEPPVPPESQLLRPRKDQ